MRWNGPPPRTIRLGVDRPCDGRALRGNGDTGVIPHHRDPVVGIAGFWQRYDEMPGAHRIRGKMSGSHIRLATNAAFLFGPAWMTSGQFEPERDEIITVPEI